MVEEVEEEEEEEETSSSQTDVSMEETQSPELDVIQMFTQTVETSSLTSLYDRLKGKPEALTQLAPAAGDAIIHLDFSCPGQYCRLTHPTLTRGKSLIS